MLMWIKIAARNLLKNQRRSLFTILAIGLGFAAVNVFGGFTGYIFTSLKDAIIYAQGNGHLTIFKKGFLESGHLDPGKYLLTTDEIERTNKVLSGFPEVILSTGQLHISGLLSNGEISTVFVAAGRVPSHIRSIRSRAPGMIGRVNLFDGKPLEDDISYGVGLSSGLAKRLDVGLDSDVIAMSPTISGQINALDGQVFQLFESSAEALNDKVMLVPLDFARSLYDTEGLDRLTILLQHTDQTIHMQQRLSEALKREGIDVDVKTWREIATFYDKVKDMFDVIFLFIFVIVFVIVVMSVVNTVGMAVMERTREIGTLRALGLKRFGIIRLFALESAILGLIGSVLGEVFTAISWLGIKIIEPTWIPPQITRRVPLEVHLLPEYMIFSVVFLFLLCTIGAIIPARKAARMGIVDSLGHA